MNIRQLPDYLVNQIAAGEVIERPAAAVKELVENAIDAGATQIDIDLRHGGKSLIRIKDNGRGMNEADLSLAVERHATSKLPSDDLVNINHLGFRGEALPSIGSVSRLKIQSKTANDDNAWEIKIEGGEKQAPSPATPINGTIIEVSDLFYATPARLKFLKSDRAEYGAVREMILRIAMAFAHVGFKLSHEGVTKLSLNVTNRKDRIGDILGKEFKENAVSVYGERGDMTLEGFTSLPTLNRASNQHQYLFVNGRPVKDKMILGCVRAAYMDVLHSGRHPLTALFLTIPAEAVDVNVHPAKTEVRFREAAEVRSLLIGALKQALHEGGMTTSSTLSTQTFSRMQGGNTTPYQHGSHNSHHGMAEKAQEFFIPLEPSARAEEHIETQEDVTHTFPMGAARAQIHENYIIAQSDKGLIIVDQHAAHERLVYEKLKNQMANGKIVTQGLLVPEIIDLTDNEISELLSYQEMLNQFGIELEPFGADSISIQSLPALLGNKINIKALIRDIIDEITEHGTTEKLQKTLFEKLSSAACHGSIRSGRRMNADEMNALLRQMEETPNSGHCNHGRPTYITLDLVDIEKLFGRR